jgi:hypothetical protein
MRFTAIATLAVCATFGFASCSSDDMDSVATDFGDAADEAGEDATESIARNIAADSGAEQFKDAGYELDGELVCEATVVEEKLSKVEISCTGTVAAGGDAELIGATNEMPARSFDQLEGLFKGTVDGNEVFATDQLGD